MLFSVPILHYFFKVVSHVITRYRSTCKCTPQLLQDITNIYQVPASVLKTYFILGFCCSPFLKIQHSILCVIPSYKFIIALCNGKLCNMLLLTYTN